MKGKRRGPVLALAVGAVVLAPVSAHADGYADTGQVIIDDCTYHLDRWGTLDPLNSKNPLNGPTDCRLDATNTAQDFAFSLIDVYSATSVAEARSEVAQVAQPILEIITHFQSSLNEAGTDVGLSTGFVAWPETCVDDLTYCTDLEKQAQLGVGTPSPVTTQQASPEVAQNMYLSNKAQLSPRTYDTDSYFRFNIFSENDNVDDKKRGLHASMDYYAISQLATVTPVSGCHQGVCSKVHMIEVAEKDTSGSGHLAEWNPESINQYGSAGSTTVGVGMDVGVKINVSNSWNRPKGESGGSVLSDGTYYSGMWRDLDGGSTTSKGLRTMTMWETPKGRGASWNLGVSYWYSGPCERYDYCV